MTNLRQSFTNVFLFENKLKWNDLCIIIIMITVVIMLIMMMMMMKVMLRLCCDCVSWGSFLVRIEKDNIFKFSCSFGHFSCMHNLHLNVDESNERTCIKPKTCKKFTKGAKNKGGKKGGQNIWIFTIFLEGRRVTPREQTKYQMKLCDTLARRGTGTGTGAEGRGVNVWQGQRIRKHGKCSLTQQLGDYPKKLLRVLKFIYFIPMTRISFETLSLFLLFWGKFFPGHGQGTVFYFRFKSCNEEKGLTIN